MSDAKKRRLNTSTPQKPLSAFEARRRLLAGGSSGSSSPTPEPASSKAPPPKPEPVLQTVSAPSRDEITPQKDRNSRRKIARTVSQESSISVSEAEASRHHVPASQTSSLTLSTFRPSNQNWSHDSQGTTILLAPGEKLVILGEAGLTIKSGSISLLGANLGASLAVHHIYAPASHSLPVIRCPASEDRPAELLLQSCSSGLQELSNLSPLFSRVWPDKGGPFPSSWLRDTRSMHELPTSSSFRILASTDDGPAKVPLQLVVAPPQWNKQLSLLSASTQTVSGSRWAKQLAMLSSPIAPSDHSRIMVCGPKSSGKSTFSKLLLNRLLSTTAAMVHGGMESASFRGVLWLDLDPGQPEFSPPGHLSLLQIKSLNLGPAFTHPLAQGGRDKVLRSHSVASVSLAGDPAFYISCLVDLLREYRKFIAANPPCPLIINTPGWIMGTGLQLLITLVSEADPTVIVYMSEEGPDEIVAALQKAAKNIPFQLLPSQQSEYTARTAANLRTMQTMSYFHAGMRNGCRYWDSRPLTSIPPYRVKYAGSSSGITGILTLGERTSSELLAEALNGALVSIIVMENDKAVRGSPTVTFGDTIQDEGDRREQATDHNDLPPSIKHTHIEMLPFFHADGLVTIDPRNSYALGQALVRGIDSIGCELHLLTPVPMSVVSTVRSQGKSLMLVFGKLETPGWAYIEDTNKASAGEAGKGVVHQEDESADDDSDSDTEAPDNGSTATVELGSIERPWVEHIQGHQGRGIGSRVWRVRRDLGKKNG